MSTYLYNYIHYAVYFNNNNNSNNNSNIYINMQYMHCILKYNIVYYAFLWVALSFLLFL